ncbi:2'-5' RNA ligase superfamily protein [Mucilaginibacter yixingensis]|uniref:2'-5' RNA ligase superfamily protein n=1 Tax=Mucilaginibacter yixingensis TaxID=1295612 RepID=A0A2T5J5P6_9SPHI|nr:2'-5' RNA ligase family protein [Mucilaginibacter yixingensis]PTQ93591.1 2'-5' RNA ligase superfamily protein [Mucilaginibacter yixingensis]
MTSYTDYLMIISPPAEIKAEIDRYKRASARKIGEFNSLHSKAHISINSQTRCKPFHAQPAIRSMAGPLGMLPPVKLKINGFKHFMSGDKYTIFAALADDERTNNWFKLLRQQMRITTKSFIPHITVVRSIPGDAFNYLWPFFKDLPFEAEFMADRLTVLERETYILQSNWHIFTELYFGTQLLR